MPEPVVTGACLPPLPGCNFPSSAPSVLPSLSCGNCEGFLILLHLGAFTGLGHLQVETVTGNSNFARWQKTSVMAQEEH